MTIQEQFQLANEYLQGTHIDCLWEGSELRFASTIAREEKALKSGSYGCIIFAVFAIVPSLLIVKPPIISWSIAILISVLSVWQIIHNLNVPAARRTYLIYDSYSNSVIIEFPEWVKWNKRRDPKIWSAYTRDESGTKVPFQGDPRIRSPKGLLLSKPIPMEYIECFEIRIDKRGDSSSVEFYAVTTHGDENLLKFKGSLGYRDMENIGLLLAEFGDRPLYSVETKGLWSKTRIQLSPVQPESTEVRTLLRSSENPDVDGSTLLRPAKNSPTVEATLLIPAEVANSVETEYLLNPHEEHSPHSSE